MYEQYLEIVLIQKHFLGFKASLYTGNGVFVLSRSHVGKVVFFCPSVEVTIRYRQPLGKRRKDVRAI